MTPRKLYEACASEIRSYPENRMHPLPSGYPIAGRGFFPVCSGSFHEGSLDIDIGDRPIMFIGQDWGAREALPELLKDPDADMNNRGTGSILRDLLIEADIPREKCFFTNALFGVREGTKSVGRSPGWGEKAFVEDCVKVLGKQLDILKPRALICLGRDSPDVVKKIYPDCGNWNKSFRKIDAAGDALLTFDDAPHCAILLHPSFRTSNLRHRTVGDVPGKALELGILRKIRDHASRGEW